MYYAKKRQRALKTGSRKAQAIVEGVGNSALVPYRSSTRKASLPSRRGLYGSWSWGRKVKISNAKPKIGAGPVDHREEKNDGAGQEKGKPR